MAKILIKGGRVWDGQQFFCADVLVDGTKIVQVEQNISEPAYFVYDAAGMTVTAGLVDAHMHMKGITCQKYGAHPEMSCFPFGVTAAADAGGELGDRALLDSFLVKNAVFAAVSIQNNRPDLARVTAKLADYGQKAVGLKVYFDTTDSPVKDITPLREVCDFAHEKGLRVMVHCSHSPVPMAQILDVLAAGDILTHAFHGAEHSAAEDRFESMKQAQSRGVVIDTGFAGNVHTDFGVLRDAIQSGIVPDVISTDLTPYSAYIRGGRYGMTTCMNMAIAAGMQEEAVFHAVTSNPAKALGKAEEWGCLQPGRTADLAVLAYTNEGFDMTDNAGNRLHSQKGYRCKLTVADGQVIFRD